MMQLTYISVASEEITPSLILDMLESARKNNAPLGVTGLLYCAQGQFAQCLEGEVDAVERIYAKIESDPRHRNLIASRHESSASRVFSDWAMAFVDTNSAEAARVLLQNDTNSYKPTEWRRSAILPILTSLGQALRAERIAIRY